MNTCPRTGVAAAHPHRRRTWFAGQPDLPLLYHRPGYAGQHALRQADEGAGTGLPRPRRGRHGEPEGDRLRRRAPRQLLGLHANTRNNPVEDIEAHVPLRINSYELIEAARAPASGAAGWGPSATSRSWRTRVSASRVTATATRRRASSAARTAHLANSRTRPGAARRASQR